MLHQPTRSRLVCRENNCKKYLFKLGLNYLWRLSKSCSWLNWISKIVKLLKVWPAILEQNSLLSLIRFKICYATWDEASQLSPAEWRENKDNIWKFVDPKQKKKLWDWFGDVFLARHFISFKLSKTSISLPRWEIALLGEKRKNCILTLRWDFDLWYEDNLFRWLHCYIDLKKKNCKIKSMKLSN